MKWLTTVKHWAGIVFGFAVSIEHAEENIAPKIEEALNEGIDIAKLIPIPISQKLAALLTAGVEVVGAVDKTFHYMDADFQKYVKQAQDAVAPDSGYTVVLIKKEVADDVKEFLAQIKELTDKVKDEANKITGPNGAPAAAKA